MDTIFSSASNFQKSAIKIVRISGKNSKTVPSIFSFKATKPRFASLRKIYDHKKKIIDNVLVIFFPGPFTATGEDVIELHFHGSVVIEKKIFQILSKQKNFRLAEPGEYTKRAFLNGILDLTQAEGLNDLINSETTSMLNDINDFRDTDTALYQQKLNEITETMNIKITSIYESHRILRQSGIGL